MTMEGIFMFLLFLFCVCILAIDVLALYLTWLSFTGQHGFAHLPIWVRILSGSATIFAASMSGYGLRKVLWRPR